MSVALIYLITHGPSNQAAMEIPFTVTHHQVAHNCVGIFDLIVLEKSHVALNLDPFVDFDCGRLQSIYRQMKTQISRNLNHP